MFFKDHTLLEDPLSKGFPIPGLLKRIREWGPIAGLDGHGPYYRVELTPCSQMLMCDSCCARIENPIDRHASILFCPFTQDLRCLECQAWASAVPLTCYPSQSRELAWDTAMSWHSQSAPLVVWKINNVRSWMKFTVIEHLLWKLKAAAICPAFYDCPQMLNDVTKYGFNELCLRRTGRSLDYLMYEFGHKNSLEEPVFNVQIPNLVKHLADPLRCDRCFEALKSPSAAMEVRYLRLYCSECFPLTRHLPMISESSGIRSQAVELSTDAVQIDQDRILAETLQKEFDESEAAPPPPTPSPLPRPLLAAPSPNPSPSPASDDNQAALKKLTQKATKRDVHCQLQSTVVRSETLITGKLAGDRWFAFKMYEHASLVLSPNVTEQELNEDWNSWPFNNRSLVYMGTIQKLLRRASIQLATTLRVEDQLHKFQHWIIIQNQTAYAKCSQKGCTRGLFSIGELIYVSVIELETLCFLCGPQYTDGQTIIYHPSRLLPSKPQQQPAIQQSLARLAIQDDNSSLSAPKRQKSSEGDETESSTNPRDKAVDSEPDNSTCVICLEEKAAWASIPCGHMHYCGDCIKLIKNCASCRASIQLRVRIYNS